MLTVIEPLTGQTPWQGKGISIVAGVGCQSADLAFLDGWGRDIWLVCLYASWS
jgi:hypothetical protein